MRRGADAGHAVLHLLLVRLHVVLELGEGLGRQVLLGDQHHRIGAAQADRLEVLLAVVGQRLVERDIDRQRPHVGEQQRVAVVGAFATLLTPIVPPAPPMFSTTSCWPRISLIFWQSTRASASVGPPAAKGTITVIGLVG